ncbi:MAG: hypothetical protein V1790_14010 [Planctomycetota bacterium]
MHERTVQLEVPTSFSLKATVLSHGWHECAPMSWSEGGRCFQTIERDGERVLRVSVVENGRQRRLPSLHVTVDGGDLDDGVASRTCDRLRITLGLDHDLSEFYELCADHSELAVIPRIGGGRLIRSASMTENIIKALCATNVNWTQAVKMINRIAQLGPYVPHFRSLTAWPTPREILRAGEKYLDEVCRLGYRTSSALAFCRDVCEGRFDPEALDTMASDANVSSDDLLAQLRSIRGIGPSSAHYLLGFLGRHDRLSIDSATIAHVAHTHTHGRKPTPKRIERIYAPYGRWKNLVYWCENWLTWATAAGILREAGLPRPGAEAISQRP